MSRPDGSDKDAAFPTSGRLEGTSVPQILRLAGEHRVGGSLLLKRGGMQKAIYLRDGRVVFAASNDPEERLGMLLLRRGEVGLVPLLEAGGELARGRRLGQILIDHGVMTQEAVVRAVLDQVREIALSVFDWRHGEWQLSRVGLPFDEPVTLDMTTEALILTGSRRVRDWNYIRNAVGGPRAAYQVRSLDSAATEALNLTEKSILERVQNPSRVEQICEDVYAPSYDVYRSLWALSILGLVGRVEPQRLDESSLRTNEGWLDRCGGTAGLLLELGERRFSGVLRVFSGAREGAIYLREGRVVFATTNDPERSLLAHLLRRGVISDRDHETATRRLITGKRSGTLLAESGVIDSGEIGRFVREQVLDVAESLVLVSEGEYEIEEGLPSQEEVLLDRTPEEIVISAIEAAREFYPLWRSLGDLNTLFRLTPSYLPRLDRMQLRPAVWEIVSLLAEERTLQELLEARPEPDFEICRLIYGLEKVQVISRVSQDEILTRARRAVSEMRKTHGLMDTGEKEFAGHGVVDEELEGSDDAERTPVTSATDLAPELFPSSAADERTRSFGSSEAKAESDRFPEAESDDASYGETYEQTSEQPAENDQDAQSESDDASYAETYEQTYEQPAENEPDGLVEADDATRAETHEQTADDEIAGSRRVPVVFERTAPETGPNDADVDEADSDDLTAKASDRLWESLPGSPDPAATQKLTFDQIASSLAQAEREAAEVGGEAEAPTGHEQDGIGAEDSNEQKENEIAAEERPATDEQDASVDDRDDADDADDTDDPDDTDVMPVDPQFHELVASFNRAHEIVYKQIRLEIGAGIQNYVATCIGRLGTRSAAFADQLPDRQGHFPEEPVARALAGGYCERPQDPLDALIEVELEMVQDLLPPGRMAEIQRALAVLGD